jgi:hypothetical protein
MKRDERKIALRCAVDTRVSTDSGLEQDFNSLDNQREASEAYIKSQAHERWKRRCHVLMSPADQGLFSLIVGAVMSSAWCAENRIRWP